MPQYIILSIIAVALGIAMVARKFPPAWMDRYHGTALPRDPKAWRSSWVATGWLLSIEGAVRLLWAVARITVSAE